MEELIAKLLADIKLDQASRAEIRELSERIRMAIRQDPSQGKVLGPYLSQMSRTLNAQARNPGFNWVALGGGFIAIGHRPGGKISFEGMQHAGVSVVVTLLQENEGARDIGRQLAQVDVCWIWFPFSASSPYAGDALEKVVALYAKLAELLQEGKKIYFHCSAGIHRTGMITYGFLRYLGQEKKEALATLASLRPVTAEQAGTERLAWGDQFSG